MSFWSSYIGFFLAIFATLIAIRGDTWDQSKSTFWRKITRTGWAAIFVAVIASWFELSNSIEEIRTNEIAVSPIYSDLATLAEKSDEFLMLTNIAGDSSDQRSAVARELLNLPIYIDLSQPNGYPCREFISSWQQWRLETDPRVRADLEMLEFMCQSPASKDAEFFNNFTTYVRNSVCKHSHHSRLCKHKTFNEIESDLNESMGSD